MIGLKAVKCLSRRALSLALMLVVMLALVGCRPIVADAPEALTVYATFYPIYALTDAVLRDIPDAQLHCLVQPQDGCLRSYSLSDWDVALLSGADAVMMGGRGLESFESALFAWGESGPAVCAVLYNLELYGQGSASGDGESESHLKGPNPHLYMSLDGAKQIVDSIAAMMVSLDPKFADLYTEHAEKAREGLDEALATARELLAGCEGGRVALMNEALVYCAQDYGLEVADTIERESGEALTGEALQRCLERLSDAQTGVILIEKQAPQALVQALEAAGYAVARIDVLSTHREGEGFEDYLQIQLDNARAIRLAFDRASVGKDSP